ncbi:MAG: transcriptional regulator [Deltaproteobacteria bacterium]|nr:MAG: transcriptional regulator [Deltaproteobacteria bacterium]
MSEPIRKIDHQIIEKDGKPAFAVVPYEVFQKLCQEKPSSHEATIPHAVVKANVRGDTLVKAWREHLGMTQKDLASHAGVSQPAIAKLERSGANPRYSTLEKLAEAMKISVEQLEG